MIWIIYKFKYIQYNIGDVIIDKNSKCTLQKNTKFNGYIR